ncbi:hypothetical protein D3C86_1405640 [compost metagenome]
MQACRGLVARMGEQDVDCDRRACIELDGDVMAFVMAEFGDLAINDLDAAACEIGPDVGRDVVTMREDRQRVSPVVVQPDIGVRLRAGPDEAPMPPCDFEAVAIRAGNDGRAPALGKSRDAKHLVSHAIAQDQAARSKAFAIASQDREIVYGAGNAVGPCIDEPD